MSQSAHEILNSPHDPIQYHEYKMILQPHHFQSAQSFRDFWTIVRRVAKKFDVRIEEARDAFVGSVREVLFFDTADFALYKNHFIVRMRTPYKEGWPVGIPELTVKFRHAEFETAAAVDIRPAGPGRARIKFKQEQLPLRESLGGMRAIYSHNCELAMPREQLNMAVKDLSSAFPALRQVQAQQEERITLVNDFAVEEVQVDVGLLHFGGGLVAKASICVWRDRKHERPLCGEFSFQYKFHSQEELHKSSLKQAVDFYKNLQLDAFEWVSMGTTKTAMVYQLGPNGAPKA